MERQSTKFEKRRKFLLVLPLLVIPFMTMAFWALGGGKGEAVVQQPNGVNTELPGAQLEDEPLDKMSLYGRLGLDTAVISRVDSIDSALAGETGMSTDSYGFNDPYSGLNAYRSSGYNDPNEERVRERLADLELLMQQQNERAATPQTNAYQEDASLDHLEQMMQRMSGESEPDPELEALNGMLDKIIDIQNPDRVREKSLEHRGAVFAVGKEQRSNTLPYMHKPAPDSQVYDEALFDPDIYRSGNERIEVLRMKETNSFYGIDQRSGKGYTELTAIPAVIHETQTLVSGSNLKMRLTEDVFINGLRIPKGSFVTGQCALNGERLQVQVNGIRHFNYLLPVKLLAFDLDGVEGIRIPGAISRDAAKDGADRAIQSMQLMSFDASIGTQAAGAGIEAVKGLLSKKAKLVKVTVKAGHPVLLLDEKSKNN